MRAYKIYTHINELRLSVEGYMGATAVVNAPGKYQSQLFNRIKI